MSIQPREVIVVQLNQGPTIVRALEIKATQVSIALGRNKQARVPNNRVLYATGLTSASDGDIEKLRTDARAVADGLDLEELWQLLKDEGIAFTMDDLAGLHWAAEPTTAQKIGLLIHLEETPIYFERDADNYTARSAEAIEETRSKERRQGEKQAARGTLMEALDNGALPQPMNEHHKTLLLHLRSFAINGDSYSKRQTAKDLLEYLGRVSREPQRQAFELLEAAGVLSLDEPIELEQRGIPTDFPDDALAHADEICAAAPSPDEGRVDLTHYDAFTVDDITTTDRDDALSVEVMPSGRFEIGVHITDVASLVSRGSPVDAEADKRMATLYLPEQRIGMLPPRLESERGSLDPNQTRACISLLVQLNGDGEVVDSEVVRSVIVSKGALSYDEVDTAIEDSSASRHESLATLYRLTRRLRERRGEAGAMLLEQPEMVVKVASPDDIEVEVIGRGSPSRMLVSELMILYNSLLAEFCVTHNLPAPYRAQKAPWASGAERPMVSPDMPDGPYKHFLLTRGLSPAELSTTPGPHSSLGVKAYVQASSPLRRYPDLALQRQVSEFLSTGKAAYTPDEIASVAGRADVQLREIGGIEESRKRYWFLKYLEQKYLQSGHHDFQAVALDTDRRGPAVLHLLDYPFRVRAELGSSCEPGDRVTLRLHNVDLWRRVGNFTYVGSSTA
ncbi:MAG: RNB domain-containing ribonuclease [Chloroflexi bacterium]|nr:RNB domain-containing ribonuclease [Chloroflexota bacterium]